jgi:glutamate-1-semialdehyde 2,1-aminomutase
MRLHRSRAAFRRARRSIPGGVNSPVRAFRAVGGLPILIRRGHGAWIEDIDGNRFLDYVGSWGPLILGHAHPAIVRAVASAAKRGTTFGAPTEGETELAELIRSGFPSMDLVRLVSSGTEACMSALRVARAFTKRAGVVKFEGCYHGHADPFLVKAGSGAATFGSPTSPGVEADHTIVLPYNDAAAFSRAMRRLGKKVAAVIVEPVAGNMGVVPPLAGFLETLRKETRRHGSLLIFDEVISGFRLGWGGAQKVLGVEPDLTTLGKIVGGGLPLAAYGGRREIMKSVAPDGPVYQAGTLSGNPLAVAAGQAQLRHLKANPGLYRRLDAMADELAGAFKRDGVSVNRVGSMMTVFFTPGPVVDWTSAARCDTAAYARFFRAMLAQGIYLPPSQFEAWFVSAAHRPADIQRTIRGAKNALKSL